MIETEALSARAGEGDRRFELRDASLTVGAGGYGVVIGPAGSGKTTLLEAIAGLLRPTSGRVRLHGVDVTSMPPERRGLAIVYQHDFLFPHVGVAANVSYGAADMATAAAVSARFGVDALASRGVLGLSGGERQLVAIARALATRPRVLLLDEPFGALDPQRRTAVRRELRALQREWGFTALQVTHDFAEAGALGDVVVLLDGGRVVQHGPPAEVFRRPASRFAAEFLGAENVFAGEVVGADADSPGGDRLLAFRTGRLTLSVVGDVVAGRAHAVVRAEEVLIARAPLASSARNQFEGTVTQLAQSGAVVHVTVQVDDVPFVASLTAPAVRELQLAPGERAWVAFKASAVHLC